jgi:hypothetical protein
LYNHKNDVVVILLWLFFLPVRLLWRRATKKGFGGRIWPTGHGLDHPDLPHVIVIKPKHFEKVPCSTFEITYWFQFQRARGVRVLGRYALSCAPDLIHFSIRTNQLGRGLYNARWFWRKPPGLHRVTSKKIRSHAQ